ncbi:hypothetical protein D9M71_636180 [compost metagenome]
MNRLRKQWLGRLDSDGIESTNLRTQPNKLRYDRKRRCIAHIIRVRLEGKSQYGNPLAFQRFDSQLQLVHYEEPLTVIRADNRLEQFEVVSGLIRDMRQRKSVFRETGSAVADSCLQEFTADSGI